MKDGYCDCKVKLYEDDEEGIDPLPPCGCNGQTCSGQVRTYRDTVVHLDGKHWRVTCAFEELLRRRT